MGFTLDEIRALLTLRVREAKRSQAVKLSAVAAGTRVREHLETLQGMEAVLGRLIRACDARTTTEECPILSALDPG
jgi:hypothetical protein